MSEYTSIFIGITSALFSLIRAPSMADCGPAFNVRLRDGGGKM